MVAWTKFMQFYSLNRVQSKTDTPKSFAREGSVAAKLYKPKEQNPATFWGRLFAFSVLTATAEGKT